MTLTSIHSLGWSWSLLTRHLVTTDIHFFFDWLHTVFCFALSI